jgi:hypothetical protein
MGRHLAGLVIQQDADDFLRDVSVDQPCSQGMPPLMRGEVDRAAVLVADLAVLKPSVERVSVGRGRPGMSSAGVAVVAGKQVRAAGGEAFQDAALLSVDRSLDFLVDGDRGFAFHLGIAVFQVGGSVVIVDQALEGKGAG